jgi:hypothetical protein
MLDACRSWSLILHPLSSPPVYSSGPAPAPTTPLRLTVASWEAHRANLPGGGSDDSRRALFGALSGVACNRAPRGSRAVNPRTDAS